MSSDSHSIRVLATDLDGTLIPLAGNAENRRDLAVLKSETVANRISLVFVTGRHLESVRQVMQSEGLPSPDWIICDVGTSIYQSTGLGELRPVQAYADHLHEIIASFSIEELKRELDGIQGIRLQEQEKQGRFKLSYYAQAEDSHHLVEQVQAALIRRDAPYSIVSSIDPFNGDGLIDLLPSGVSKARALDWWSHQQDYHPDSIIFAGDTGNDLAALVGGFRSILVANADEELVAQVKRIHAKRGWTDRLFVADEVATSGVLEGLRHYLMN